MIMCTSPMPSQRPPARTVCACVFSHACTVTLKSSASVMTSGMNCFPSPPSQSRTEPRISAICSIIAGTFPAPRRSIVTRRKIAAAAMAPVMTATVSSASGRTIPLS